MRIEGSRVALERLKTRGAHLTLSHTSRAAAQINNADRTLRINGVIGIGLGLVGDQEPAAVRRKVSMSGKGQLGRIEELQLPVEKHHLPGSVLARVFNRNGNNAFVNSNAIGDCAERS